MNRSRAAAALACLAASVTAAIVGGLASSSESRAAPVKKGGTLRIGTINGYDSMNPFVAYSAQSYDAFIMQYPTLVQYDVGPAAAADRGRLGEVLDDLEGRQDVDVRAAHRHLVGRQAAHRRGRGLDRQPDHQVQGRAAATLAPFISHAESFTAPTDTRSSSATTRPVGNVLPKLQQFYILPRQVWEAQIGTNGKGLKAYKPEDHLPIVSGGPFILAKYDKNGTSIFQRNPNFYGPQASVDVVGLQYFTNQDALLEAFKSGDLDLIDDVPPTAVSRAAEGLALQRHDHAGRRGARLHLQLEPEEDEAPRAPEPEGAPGASRCAIDRDQIADDGVPGPRQAVAPASSRRSRADWVNPNVKPRGTTSPRPTRILDGLGYKKGCDGVRRANGKPMAYDVITPADARRHQPRVRDRPARPAPDRRQVYAAGARRRRRRSARSPRPTTST